MTRLLISILLWITIFRITVQAQNTGSSVHMMLQNKAQKIENSTLASVSLKIFNTGDKPFQGKLITKSSKGIDLLSRPTIVVNIQKGDSLYISVKLYVKDRLVAGKFYPVQFALVSDTDTLAKEECKFEAPLIKNMSFTSLISSIVVQDRRDSIRIPIRVSNNGNTKQKVNILAKFPSSEFGDGLHTVLALNTEPYTDTIVYIKKVTGREMFQTARQPIMITGVYQNGEVFGQTGIDMQTLRNSRYANESSNNDSYQRFFKDKFTIEAQNLGGTSPIYQMIGGTTTELPAGRLGINIDATYFGQQNQLYLQNTYLGYEYKNKGISIGNLTRNFDLPLNGRGINIYLADTLRSNTIEVGLIDHSFNLTDPYVFESITSGNSAWASFEHKAKDKTYNSTLIYENNSYFRIRNELMVNNFTWSVKSLRLSGSVNGGRSTNIIDSTNSDISRQQKLGWLGTVNADANIGKFFFSSANTLSSPYYPGMRKGAMSFTERVTHNGPKINFWISGNYLNFAPRYIEQKYTFTSIYGSQRFELGVGKSFGRLTVSLSPIYTTDKSSFLVASDSLLKSDMKSMRLIGQFNYYSADSRLSIYLNIEKGKVKDSFTGIYSPQIKLNSNFKYHTFNLNANYQRGIFYIGEALTNKLSDISYNENYSISPSFQKKIFNKRVNLELGATYFKTSVQGSSLLFNGRATYKTSSSTEIYGGLFRSQYSYNQFIYNNLQIGVTQKLKPSRLGMKHNSLSIFLFKDVNENGYYDTRDSVAKNQVIYVDDVAFITDGSGKITYKNLIEGYHKVSLSNSSKWHIQEQQVLLNRKSMTVALPLRKTGIIKGSISYLFNDLSYEISKEKAGFSIITANEQGELFKTKTDERGRFVFYLPAGDYTIAIDTKQLPYELSVPKNFIKSKLISGTSSQIDFELKVKDRKIETKKFPSNRDREKEREREREKEKH